MGQQQLLLIVLAMILIGAAILVGMQIYDESNREAAIDVMSKDLMDLAGQAMNYYRTPTSLGGGGQSFMSGSGGWEVPNSFEILDNRKYSVSTISSNSLEILGQSLNNETGKDNIEGVKVFLQINNNSITDMRIEN